MVFKQYQLNLPEKKEKKFKPTDIIYKPTKNPETSPLCYFTEDTSIYKFLQSKR